VSVENKVAGGWRKLGNDEVNNFYSSPNIRLNQGE
jgi:hypothetical protein